MNTYQFDNVFDVIEGLKRILMSLDSHIIKEVNAPEGRKEAGDIVENIESEVARIKQICQNGK